MFVLKRRILIFLYFILAICFVFTVGGYFYIEEITQFEETVAKINYQLGYNDIYAVKNTDNLETALSAENVSDKKTVYLTFDDGPSMRTVEILDILKEYNIKATFFILSDQKDSSRDIVKRIFDEGHSIGVHSASHDYTAIYKSVNSFLADFEECYKYIEDITNEKPIIFRFPGGSVNSYNKDICKELVAEMTRRGFTYFDWNVSSDDAVKGYTQESIYTNVIEGCKKNAVSVVLMHDSAPKKDTVAALKQIIPELLKQGYTFDKLDETAQPTVFRIE